MSNQKNDSTLLELAMKDYEEGSDIQAIAYTLDITPDQFLSLYLKRKNGLEPVKTEGFPTLRLALENAKKVEEVNTEKRQSSRKLVRLTFVQKEEVYELMKQGVLQREIAETYGIGISTLHKIKKTVEESRAKKAPKEPKEPEVHAPTLPVETPKAEGIKIMMTDTHVNISIPRKDFVRSLLKDLL